MKLLVRFFVLLICINIQSCKQPETSNSEQIKIETPNHFLDRIEPPNWWIGFKNEKLQLLVKNDNISKASVSINYPGITLSKINKGTSPNYLFLDLEISDDAKAGQFNITFTFSNGEEQNETYELKNREKSADDYVGFDSSDVIYLITPDRFANGNPANDVILKSVEENREASTQVSSLKETTINRAQDYSRHGGDITGITNHLDYIDEMGFTAIWSSPLIVNDMPRYSYHGYAMTDFYQVDPRFGTLAEYRELADKAREKGIKVIMDQIANHCGLYHWWMQDLPFDDWVNYQKDFEAKKPTNYSNHRRTSNQDTYASNYDKKLNSDGWFTSEMPDLNQRNPFMANYLTQNSIWWIETLGLGGIRQDTYPYPDKAFMSDWAGAIMTEYPNFNIVGEEWSYNPLLVGYWQTGANNKDGYESNLRSTMDFPMQQLVVDGIKQGENWDSGLVKIYEGLANDFAYASPKDIMVFPDNHDMDRIFTQLKEDVINTRMALSTYLVLPRIPQIYYGTEILMQNSAKPGDHGLIRTDFPGGWDGDIVNAFTGEGLTKDQKEIQQYLKKLLNFRKGSKAIHDGETLHFSPFLGTYFLFRITKDETVVHIINKNEKPLTINLSRYKEVGLNGKTLTNVITGETMVWNDEDDITFKEKGSIILTTKNSK